MSEIRTTLESLGYTFKPNGSYLRCVERDSLVINVNTNFFYWNEKGIGGNAYQFLTKIMNFSSKDAMQYLNNLGFNTDIPVNHNTYTHKIINTPSKEQMEYLFRRTKYYHNMLMDNPDRMQYWTDSGINESSVKDFKLGWAFECPFMRNIESMTIPNIKDGKVINIKHRLNTQSQDRYRPELAGIGTYLFNSDGLHRQNGLNWPGDAVLLEGEKKAIVFHQNGFRVASIPGAAGWRTSYIDDFNKAGIDHIYVILDPGMEERSNKITYDIKKHGKKAKSVYLSHKPDDMIIQNLATPKDIINIMY